MKEPTLQMLLRSILRDPFGPNGLHFPGFYAMLLEASPLPLWAYSEKKEGMIYETVFSPGLCPLPGVMCLRQ